MKKKLGREKDLADIALRKGGRRPRVFMRRVRWQPFRLNSRIAYFPGHEAEN